MLSHIPLFYAEQFIQFETLEEYNDFVTKNKFNEIEIFIWIKSTQHLYYFNIETHENFFFNLTQYSLPIINNFIESLISLDEIKCLTKNTIEILVSNIEETNKLAKIICYLVYPNRNEINPSDFLTVYNNSLFFRLLFLSIGFLNLKHLN